MGINRTVRPELTDGRFSYLVTDISMNKNDLVLLKRCYMTLDITCYF